MERRSSLCGVALFLLAAALLPIVASGSSHSDAPLIKQDPQANLTDVYAFVGTKYNDANTKVLNVVVNVRPFSEPGDGAIYDRFADDARYSIHITDPTTGKTKIRYDFRFSAVTDGYKNLDTILSYGRGTEVGPIQEVGDARQNFTQTYSVMKVTHKSGAKKEQSKQQESKNDEDADADTEDQDDSSGNGEGHGNGNPNGNSASNQDHHDGKGTSLIGMDLLAAPPNVGKNTTPLYNDADGVAISGAADFASLDPYTRQTIHDLSSGEVAFAGPRDDSFFADAPGIFDLLNARILDNNGSLGDGLGQDGGGVDGFKGFNVLTYALQIPIASLSPTPYDSTFFGMRTGVGVYATVSRPKVRMLNPNGKHVNAGPWVQVNRLGNPLFNEVLVALRDKDKFNRTSPQKDAANYAKYASTPEIATLINTVFGTTFVTTGRDDLVKIFIPDVLRVATTTDPVRLAGDAGFSRLGFIGGDTTNGVSGGWPNGRRFGDDVVDIALTAVASGPAYSPIVLVGDNVAANDIAYNRVFPYAATPHSGTHNRKDPE